MSELNPVVYVVDDDLQMRTLVRNIVHCLDLECQTFASAEDFLGNYQSGSGCIITDVRMPGMDGVELLEAFGQLGIALPCILITGHGDIPLTVRAMQSNAVDVIEKPFQNIVLLNAIQRAIELDQENRQQKETALAVLRRLEQLTERESEVMEGVLQGHSNKQMAFKSNVSVKTIEAHRSRMMKKMKTYSVAELVKQVTEARLELKK
ncbi:response regulator transcription factor [Thalassoglobus polymorphus]|uniref:Response regulator protein TmoT n=1 Tax=Thalassoglobus polymorphus TaxID=2527994 RepID=A0A517QRB0_9PLAN|nr:response regulator [Thalassoglobus polymorphus]QDT34164.1 Response regulator protein TmoT [Thalassoglobus polymorphus]